jgi:hypothetical protein
MQAKNPDYRRVVYEGFTDAVFVGELGVKFADCGPGWCASQLSVERVTCSTAASFIQGSRRLWPSTRPWLRQVRFLRSMNS